MISIETLSTGTFRVTVQSRTTTHHTVTLSEEYHRQLTGGRHSAELLIKESFRFLLEREPNTSILTRFELSLIGHYFPEFEQEISRRLERGNR